MNRRRFIALVGTGVAVWSLSAQAQQPGKIWRIGFIAHRDERFYEPLFGRLRELGYEEGRNLIVERRYAQGHADRFQEFADEMVRLNVDVIIVVTTPAAQAAKRATTHASPLSSGAMAWYLSSNKELGHDASDAGRSVA